MNKVVKLFGSFLNSQNFIATTHQFIVPRSLNQLKLGAFRVGLLQSSTMQKTHFINGHALGHAQRMLLILILILLLDDPDPPDDAPRFSHPSFIKSNLHGKILLFRQKNDKIKKSSKFKKHE